MFQGSASFIVLFMFHVYLCYAVCSLQPCDHLLGKRADLLSLSSWCLMIVMWLFLVVPWVSLQLVIVVFPNHTHYFFLALLHVLLSCIYVTLPCGGQGQVWYLIIPIPDLCLPLHYKSSINFMIWNLKPSLILVLFFNM